MKVFITVLILIFSVQSWTKADDISEFEIEGMSVGDSLLDYFTKEKIQNSKRTNYPSSDKFFQINFVKPKNFKTYEDLTVLVKSNDKNYIIYEFSGYIDFPNDINGCYTLEKKVIKDIKKILLNVKFDDTIELKKIIDKSGKSKMTATQFYPEDGGVIKVSCHDWSAKFEKNGEIDSLSVSVASEEAFDWYINEAYK